MFKTDKMSFNSIYKELDLNSFGIEACRKHIIKNDTQYSNSYLNKLRKWDKLNSEIQKKRMLFIEQKIYDFYIFDLCSLFKKTHDNRINLYLDYIQDLRKKLILSLKNDILTCVFYEIYREYMKYRYTEMEEYIENKNDPDIVKENLTKIHKWDKKIPQKTIVKCIEFMFNEMNWSESYGGFLWGDICSAWINLYNAKNINDISVWIDHLIDIEHNTGSVFKRGSLNFNTFLILKLEVEKISDILPLASTKLKPILYRLSKYYDNISYEDCLYSNSFIKNFIEKTKLKNNLSVSCVNKDFQYFYNRYAKVLAFGGKKYFNKLFKKIIVKTSKQRYMYIKNTSTKNIIKDYVKKYAQNESSLGSIVADCNNFYNKNYLLFLDIKNIKNNKEKYYHVITKKDYFIKIIKEELNKNFNYN